MANFKVNLEQRKEDDKFILKVIYYGKSSKEENFRFFNATKGLEAQDLKIEDKNGKILELVGDGNLSPKKWETIETTISNTKPFIYESVAYIDDYGKGYILLDFLTAKYALKIGETYYIYLHYQDEVTDKIEIVF